MSLAMRTGSESFTYDNEGQLATGHGAGYAFDYEHRLTGVGATAQYRYDGIGNRLEATRNNVTIRYIYDLHGNLIAEADGANTITRYYIHGLGLLAMVTPAGATYCYHFNQIGSTVALTDMTPEMVNQYAYTPFGTIANQTEAIAQPFTFVGQMGVMTEPNGFYYMRARYYDPAVRRFISEDPIGFDGGDLNLYAYVGGNPMVMVDSGGNLAAPWHFLITYVASRDAGNGIMASLNDGWDAMAVDFKSGSQSSFWLAANKHAMSGIGVDGNPQSSAEAIQATRSFIQTATFYNHADAVHATQDLATPLHAGNEWKGFGFNLETLLHLLGDLFPSTSTINEAYRNTRKLY